jgi:glycosyltransferase involved in cell wall biosynthesis
MQPTKRLRAPLVLVVDRYPDFAAPHIAHLFKGLEARGLPLEIWSLRPPLPEGAQPVHEEVTAQVNYLPPTLSGSPLRVMRAWGAALLCKGYPASLAIWSKAMLRAPGPRRLRELGQASVLQAEATPEARFFFAIGLGAAGGVARLAARMRGGNWAVLATEPGFWGLPEAERVERVASAAFCMAGSDAVADTLRGSTPGHDRLSLSPLSLDLSFYTPQPHAELPRIGDSGERAVRLVSVGPLEETQGLRDMLTALSDMPKGTHWRWTHIGSGPLLTKLRKFAQTLNLDARIKWQEACDETAILTALREAEIFVHCPRPRPGAPREGVAPAILAAASQCLPIIATRYGGAGSFLDHDVNALVVRAGKPLALTEALHQLARDPATRARLGKAARERVEKEHNLAHVLDDLTTRLQRVLA